MHRRSIRRPIVVPLVGTWIEIVTYDMGYDHPGRAPRGHVD